MKSSLSIGAAALMVAVVSASAGWFGSGPATDPSVELAKLFGTNTAFTATADISVAGSIRGEKHAAEMQYAFLNGMTRTEIDMGKTKAGAKRAEAMEQIAALGMSQIINLHRPDKKVSYVIYPGLQSYCEMPVTDAPATGNAPPKIDKKPLGQENLDGHPCVKSLVTVTNADGTKNEFTVWEATDLGNFPIQSVMESKGDTVTTRFRDIKRGKPAAALFEVPASYTKYESVQDMMMAAAQKLMGK